MLRRSLSSRVQMKRLITTQRKSHQRSVGGSLVGNIFKTKIGDGTLNIIGRADKVRLNTINRTSRNIREKYSQYLTPPETALTAVSMFSKTKNPKIDCLDLGAGTGILTVALYERFKNKINKIDAVEIDKVLSSILSKELSSLNIPYELIIGDAFTKTPNKKYDCIILNPPYKKMKADDARQKLLPCNVANLYAAFMLIGLTHLKKYGEMIAIVPRSWTNGQYFNAFRKYIFNNYSLDFMHIYGSRKDIFSDTNVLQETMIVKFSKQRQTHEIFVSYSESKSDNVKLNLYKADELINFNDLTVRVVPKSDKLPFSTIKAVGLCPSTGKIVDFRNKDSLYKDNPHLSDVYPLFYAGNFVENKILHPRNFGKPQWFLAKEPKQKRTLIQPGAYTIIKRFTSKEEKKRVVAYPLVIKNPVALENHLNFIHEGTSRKVVPLRSKRLAEGLALWCNSSLIDEWFRGISGSTQVNASDIKQFPCPTLKELEKMGRFWKWNLTQEEIDKIVEKNNGIK